MSMSLFIGGPADGDRREVDPHIECYIVLESPPPIAPDDYPPDRFITYVQHHYLYSAVRDMDGVILWVCYVHESLNGANIMDLLIAGYRPGQ